MRQVLALDRRHKAALGEFETYRSPIEIYEQESDGATTYSLTLTVPQKILITDQNAVAQSLTDIAARLPVEADAITELYSLNHKLTYFTPLWSVNRLRVHLPVVVSADDFNSDSD
jgi:hypothetical protein